MFWLLTVQIYKVPIDTNYDLYAALDVGQCNDSASEMVNILPLLLRMHKLGSEFKLHLKKDWAEI